MPAYFWQIRLVVAFYDQRKTNLAKTPSLGSSPRHEALNSFYLKRLTLVGSPL